jgi:hypothetical protein
MVLDFESAVAAQLNQTGRAPTTIGYFYPNPAGCQELESGRAPEWSGGAGAGEASRLRARPVGGGLEASGLRRGASGAVLSAFQWRSPTVALREMPGGVRSRMATKEPRSRRLQGTKAPRVPKMSVAPRIRSDSARSPLREPDGRVSTEAASESGLRMSSLKVSPEAELHPPPGRVCLGGGDRGDLGGNLISPLSVAASTRHALRVVTAHGSEWPPSFRTFVPCAGACHSPCQACESHGTSACKL